MKMSTIRTLAKESNWSSQRVLEEAVRYFGPEGLGLQVTEVAATSASFVGGGGCIQVEIGTLVQDKPTTVEVRTDEWYYHAKRFLDQI
jgi:hypothetical protein